MSLIISRAGADPILEIGCGLGDDTLTMTSAGLSVNAFDISSANVAMTALRVPLARVECRDVRAPFPEDPRSISVVVASLSLHYFEWNQTTLIVDRIWDCLRPGGVLICRLNSTDDLNFGAASKVQIEDNFYLVNGRSKRFFNQGAVSNLFSDGWRELSVEHRSTHKYLKRKALWEIVLEKTDAQEVAAFMHRAQV
ncbi:class I SAM-dependent methyltransferase [Alcaligenaceae bacterium B3P038]|nr:class I SAM-dependent methyltransferase [Alcaligenaceae bacterium B3P038]